MLLVTCPIVHLSLASFPIVHLSIFPLDRDEMRDMLRRLDKEMKDESRNREKKVDFFLKNQMKTDFDERTNSQRPLFHSVEQDTDFA